MKNFLDALMRVSKLGLIHGRVNDLFLSSDLQLRNIEQYILELLKARGVEHVIFYGSEGNRGAFTLDENSARYFFGDVPAADANAPAPGSAAADLIRRRSAPTGAQQPPARAQGAQGGVVYARRNWALSEFVSAMLRRLNEENANMAIVFYNILTTPMGSSPALIDELLTGLQRSLGNNLCLMIAPGSEFNCTTLMHTLDTYQLGSFFCTCGSSDRREMNPQTTFRIGTPDVDEMSSLLYRLQMGIGTNPGRTLQLGEAASELALELVYASRYNRSPDCYRTLRELISLLTDYANRSDAPLTRERIDDLLECPVQSRVSALEALNRPGWESVYQEMVKMNKLLRKRIQEAEQELKAQKPACTRPTLDCIRVCIPDKQESVRISVPNLLLMGSPGVGKTTLAQHIGLVMKETGVLRLGHLHMTGQDKLVSSLVGGTRQNVLAACDAAEDGVLLVDDAQSLIKSRDGGVNHSGTAHEIVETLVRALTDPKRHFCLILAGYEKEIMEVLEKFDDGLPRRFHYEGFNTHLVIPDYKPGLLRTILVGQIEKRGCTLDPALITPLAGEKTPLDCFVERIYGERNRRTFGNADAMIKLANAACDAAEDSRVVGIPQLCLTGGRTEEWFRPRETAYSLKTILDGLSRELVGMEIVHTFLSDRANEIEEMQALGKPTDAIFSRAIAIEGQAGVGKTTIAKKIGELYYGLGLSGTSKTIVHSAAELNSPQSGGNEAMILEWLSDAADRRAVLFVDEAHQLRHPSRIAAFNALMAPLTDETMTFQLVLAGYPEPMEQLIAADRGGNRRFVRLVLNDYTGDELYDILLRMMQMGGYRVAGDAQYFLHRMCTAIYETRDEATGNAGAMEILLEQLNIARRRRLKADGIPFTADAAREFTVYDLNEILPMQKDKVRTRFQEMVNG